MNTSISTEAGDASAVSGQSDKTDASTAFDDGQGVKTQIVMTGPLSEILSRALGLHFQKKDLVENSEEDEEALAVESAQQDSVLEQEVENMPLDPELSVVLNNINVADVKDHCERVESGKPLAQNETQREQETIPVYATSLNGAISPEEAMTLLDKGSDWEAIMVVLDDQVLGASDGTDVKVCSVVVNAVPEDTGAVAAAIERLYAGTNIKVCYGLEGLAKTLKDWKK